MHDIDPYKDREPVEPVVVTPVVPATPVVDPTVGPVTPVTTVAVEQEYGRPNPFPYIAGFVLLVLGAWGLFAFNSRDDRDAGSDHSQVGYVEQTLAPQPSPFARNSGSQPTTDRMAEDQARDHMRDIAREEIARDANRAKEYNGGQTMQADYDNQVASVDLSNDASTARQQAPTALPAPDTAPDVVPQTAQTTQPAQAAVVAVQDLDYSDRTDIAPLTEFELRAQLTQLDADIDATEGMARDTNQTTGLETLDQRLDALEDRFGDSKSPLAQADLLAMTRQVYELRDELTAFQTDLRAL